MTAGRDVDQPLPFLRAARGIFDLTLEGMVWSRRSLFMALLLGLPAVLALAYRIALAVNARPGISGPDLYGNVVALYYVRGVLPLVALFYATSLVADEIEGRTITYLFTRPIPRPSILAGKFAAYLATSLSLALPATLATYFLLATAPGAAGVAAGASDLVRDLGVVVLALLSYGALFTLLGVFLRRPVIPGLLFLFVWELLANLPGYLPRVTLTAYLRSLLRHRPPEEGLFQMATEVLPLALCLGVLAGVTLLCLACAFWIFSSREYVLEQ